MAIGSPALLNNSIIPRVNPKSSALNRVSPSKGTLLINTTSLNCTVALGKLRKRLKSASEKSSVAFTFLLTRFLTMSPALASKKNGAAIKIVRIKTTTIPITFTIFLPIIKFKLYRDLAILRFHLIPILRLVLD